MAFSTSSYYAGVGTVFAAVILGFAGGAMMTTGSTVQPPNRLERLASSAALPSSNVQRADVPKSSPQEPQNAAAPAIPAPASDPQPPAPPVMAKSEDAATPTVQQPPPPPTVIARSEAAPAAKNERASFRSESKREPYRKRDDERNFAERRRHRDIEDAANAVRQMRRDGVIDQVVQRDETPRFGFFGND